MTRFAHLMLLLGAATTAGCGVVSKRPRQPPTRRAPALAAPTAPPIAGHGRTYFDVDDGPTRIDERSGDTFNLVCISPCWADLTVGDHDLVFSPVKQPGQADHDVVKVFERPMIYRRALGRTDLHVNGKLLGLLGVSVGSSLLLSGGLTSLISSDGSSNLSNGLFLSGAVLTAVGAYLMHKNRTVKQDGAWATWPVNQR